MDATADSSLISRLESSNYAGLHSLFSSHLLPFSPFISAADPKLKNHKKKSFATATATATGAADADADAEHRSSIRSLAKKFLPFLNRALSLLPKCLSHAPKSQPQFDDPALQLFETYRLCLKCLECISSQLSGKPYSVHLQRVRMIHCFEVWGRYEDVECEGFAVLESLKCIDIGNSGSMAVKSERRYVPHSVEGVDPEFAYLVVEVVVTLVKNASARLIREAGVYRRVLVLVDEVRQWLRFLDANAHDKLHRALVSYLQKCTLFLVGELLFFDMDLICGFCSVTLNEYAVSSMKNQIHKFACRICSCLFLQQDNVHLDAIDILICLLDSIAHECKVEIEETMLEFLELISYCTNKCLSASTNICKAFAKHLCKIADDFSEGLAPFGMILRLYAAGLYLTDCNVLSRSSDSKGFRNSNDKCAITILLKNEDIFPHLTALSGAFVNSFHICSEEKSMPFSAEFKDSVGLISSPKHSNYEASVMRHLRNGKGYLFCYLSALRFLCQPLSEIVNSERKTIIAEDEVFFSNRLRGIQVVFWQFCDTFLFYHRCTLEREREGFEISKTILSVAVAAFTLSLRTKLDMQRSANFIKHVISSEWIQPQGLKFLFASLHNIGVILYRNKELKEASKALKLCCRASWACVSLLGQMLVDKSSDLSEAALVDFVKEASVKSAFLLDVLYQCGSHKLNKIFVQSFESWLAAEKLCERLPSPVPLVKQWVKIKCKLHMDADVEVEGSTPTLYCLLSSLANVSKSTIGIILEQELVAYEKMSGSYPNICQEMQMKIINILLNNVYITRDTCLLKSRIFVVKGRLLRAHGFEALKDCIECLSEAISTINDICGETQAHDTPLRLCLAVAYCLRALCGQEAEPNSTQVFQDIQAALDLWLSIYILGDYSENDHCDMAVENTMVLLYHIVDLLSIKGHTKFHHDIYKLVISLFKRKNVPLEKCLALLWEYRRLGHALCASPINEGFIMNLSEHCGELSKSMDFWVNCMKGSRPLLVGFQQSFSFSTIVRQDYHQRSSLWSDIGVDEVKGAALDLISSVPVSSHSAFLSSYLYYDMCERLIANGRLIEALSYAKEALRLRSKLLQEKFNYSVELQNEIYNGNGEVIQRRSYGLGNLRLISSVATEIFPFDTTSRDIVGCVLTPWSVLQCYLESTLQVGIIHEIIGNESEAEILLLSGKNISYSEGLPLFVVSFSSVLGKLYRKKQLWDLAEKELNSAKQVLVQNSGTISCLKCRLIWEVTIDQQLGHLLRCRSESATGDYLLKRLSYAENLYKLALDKLNLSEWKNPVSYPKGTNAGCIKGKTLPREVECGGNCDFSCFGKNQSDMRAMLPKDEVPEEKMKTRKSRKNTKTLKKNLPRDQCLVSEDNVRVTRSRYRSSQSESANLSGGLHIGLTKHANSMHTCTCSYTSYDSGSLLEIEKPLVDLGSEGTCICLKMKCWHCLPQEVGKSGFVSNFVHLKWEFIRRRLLLKLLACIGKCLGLRGEIHAVHEIFLQSLSVLVSRNAFHPTRSSIPLAFSLDFIGKEISGDLLAVERAALIYSICWFSLKSYNFKDTRISCCGLAGIQLQRMVSWLMLAFVLCREVPILFQKVSRLLLVIILYSTSYEPSSLSLSSCKSLSEAHWASYFHQASIGTHLNYQLLSSFAGKHKAQTPMDFKDSHVGGAYHIRTETYNMLRLAPESFEDLEEFVTSFFQGLPCTTVICISFLGDACAGLLRELLLFPSLVNAWMIISRMNQKSQPVVILLPVGSFLEGDDATSRLASVHAGKDSSNQWHCPWGSNIIDDVAPVFKLILEENYLSSSIVPLEDTKRNRSLWWTRRMELDQHLGKFLMDLEDLWFGSWKYLLLGELSDCEHLDLVHKKLVHDLKFRCRMDVNESVLRVLLGGTTCAFVKEECLSEIFLKKGCYIGGVGHGDTSRTCCNTSNGVRSPSKLAFQLLLEAAKELEVEECLPREPVILVLDCEVQMIPWENIPILRNQEVYRMPSIGSISATIDRRQHCQDLQVRTISEVFPLIDPLDAFYLLNPSGDLSSTQAEFESWFRNHNFEGKAGTEPTTEELTMALGSHDLFIYFGHGSGAQYIPGHEILKLENCAATLLMGCSSGSLTLNGCYPPRGTPLYYLLAGSPVIVANLWEVTDKDIDRFGKAMLDAWMKERSMPALDCARCNLLAKEFKCLNIYGSKGNPEKKIQKRALLESCDKIECKHCFDHRPKIGSFMGQARKACNLPFLIGASPVCYGVPTGIRKKDS
ncbi:separase isoform X2 [Malania oleifera]|uniref:separase isoform X2 n=1 Tax=Malania oleifera TaxID=397392 RepID=UPI0025AEC10F|nr:separase isoform X2 [Malania oleifera]